jgi:hypothetical protein
VLGGKKGRGVIINLIFVLILGSCRNSSLPWRSGNLVAQMYTQYKQEILLVYNDLNNEMMIDHQHGYERAYYDNYRHQIIFTTQWTLDYMLGDKYLNTTTEELGGYVYQVLFNDKYQIGIEMLDIDRSDLGQGDFDGARIRIKDLNRDKDLIVSGFPSNVMLAGDYVYCNNYDKNDNRFLDIINIEMMQHVRINTTANDLTFFYQMGDKVFAQSIEEKKTFLITEKELIEQVNPVYNIYHIIDEGIGTVMLKDIAPINSGQHWYVNPLKQYGVIYEAEILKFRENDGKRVFIDFERNDIIGLRDVTNFGNDNVAIFLATKDDEGEVHAIINVYDMEGKKVSEQDITELRGDKGRFTYLDYVE